MESVKEDNVNESESNIVTEEQLEILEEVMPNVTLETRLKALKADGIVGLIKGAFPDSQRWSFEGRPLAILSGVFGTLKWEGGPSEGFSHQHDVAVDVKTNSIVAYART